MRPLPFPFPLSLIPRFPLPRYTVQILIVVGGGGSGLMIARGMAANGAKVYIAGRRVEVLEGVGGVWGEQGGELIPYVPVSHFFIRIDGLMNGGLTGGFGRVGFKWT